jgi:ADP-ribose pyrophosphatase YjhB (NUDIX family)
LSHVVEPRSYQDRPYLAVSAAIVRDGRLLLVRRAKLPAQAAYTFPGGVVEAGETLIEALRREIAEETSLAIAPLALAGHREFIVRDEAGRVARHFVILAFAARWIAGEPVPSDEIVEARWVEPTELDALPTTEGLAEIARAALAQIDGKDS